MLEAVFATQTHTPTLACSFSFPSLWKKNRYNMGPYEHEKLAVHLRDIKPFQQTLNLFFLS